MRNDTETKMNDSKGENDRKKRKEEDLDDVPDHVKLDETYEEIFLIYMIILTFGIAWIFLAKKKRI